ncbi:pyrroloquinoline quinone precursor peptide PqqA [Acetobacteraceae bacterium KSS8]|uniref:Coenzyme PQQ synthesis protein A n=1 Tax=Endosaccharibacter trunci TaxID=2812733 RepID=A0ABT1W898_9PROT|nr:pyrroloquinoline quinone precursor peptide PqqA [Acetobacteraceae bacterium KSS8]
MSSSKEFPMAWTTPRIVEIPVGAEINSYVCGTRS